MSGATPVGEGELLLGIVLRQVDAVGAADGDHLAHEVEEEPARLRVFADRADGAAHRRGGAGERDQEHEFLPDLAADVGGELGIDAAGAERLEEALGPRRRLAVELAEHQALQRADPRDDAGLCDRRRDIADPAHDPLGTEGFGQHLVLEHAVLERDHHRVRPDHRLDLGERLLGVPQLDGEEDEVDDPDGRGIVGGGDLQELERVGAGDGEAVLAHRREMGAARDEGHVGAAFGEARAEIAADAARTHDRHAHRFTSSRPASVSPSGAACSTFARWRAMRVVDGGDHATAGSQGRWDPPLSGRA